MSVAAAKAGADVARQGQHGDENGLARRIAAAENKSVLTVDAGLALGTAAGKVPEEFAQLPMRRVGADAEAEDPIEHAKERTAAPPDALPGALTGMGRGGKLSRADNYTSPVTMER
jgi:hypothetical protein